MKLSTAGAKMIETFEGFRARPYHGQADPPGLWTIGYGTTEGIGPDTPPITAAQAQALMMRDVDRRFAPAINALRLPLNQNQFDALVSLLYNVGTNAILPGSTIGGALRARDWDAAANGFLLWDKAEGGVVISGLVKRREAERALFLRPVNGKAAPVAHRDHIHHDDTHAPRPSFELTPEELAAASHNGNVPDHLLTSVPGGRLRLDAAAAFNAMNAESERRFGVTLRSEGPLGTYRTVPEQQYLYRLYQEHEGALAAVPGTSNHGLGLAIDLGTQQMRAIVNQIGAPYGWAKRWSDAPGEWWHLRYRPGVWHPTETPTPVHVHSRPDTRTEATAIAQQLLRRHGFPTLPVDGEATPATRAALLAFQRAHGLEPTGTLDRATVDALRGEPAPPPKRHPHPHEEQPVNPDASQQPILSNPRLPLNRILALLGPFIAIFAGGVASWLSQNFPGLVTDDSTTRADIIQGTTFVVGVLITWAIQHKYLEGWQRWEGGLLDIELAKQSNTETTSVAFEPYRSARAPRYEPFDVDPSMFEGAGHDARRP